MTTLYPRTSDHACFNMAPPDRNGLHASFILRATDTNVFVFLKKRKAADSPSFWLSNSTRPVAVQDDGQYGTWFYAQSYADLISVTFSTLQANSTVCAVQYQLSPRCSYQALVINVSTSNRSQRCHHAIGQAAIKSCCRTPESSSLLSYAAQSATGWELGHNYADSTDLPGPVGESPSGCPGETRLLRPQASGFDAVCRFLRSA